MISEEKNDIVIESKESDEISEAAVQEDINENTEKKDKKTDKVGAKTRAAVSIVCAASVICVPFIAASGANMSEQAKVAEADMQVEKTLVAESEPAEDKVPIDLSELSSGITASDIEDQLVVNTVGIKYDFDTAAIETVAEEEAEEAKEEEKTEEADKEEVKEEVNEDDAASSTKEDEPKSEYALGDKHSYVAKIQERLMELNYMEDDSPTTLFGPLTSQAISYFQRKNGLSMTGVADQKTLKLLFSSDAKVYSATQGARGDDITLIQERLNELGYTCKADGYFGAKTKAAIMAFQENNGLTADGTVGSHTREILFSSSAKKASKTNNSTKTDTAKTDTEKTDTNKTETAKTDSSNSSSSSSNSSSSSSSEKKEEKKSNELKGDNSNAPSPNSSKVDALISAAESLLGKPYVYGGKGPDEFDCSGFVWYALNQSGFKISYMTSGGWANSGYATIYGMDNLKRGDIICFKGHVGICLGGDDMIDASTAKGQIRKFYGISGNSYWQEHFICGKRPLV